MADKVNCFAVVAAAARTTIAIAKRLQTCRLVAKQQDKLPFY